MIVPPLVGWGIRGDDGAEGATSDAAVPWGPIMMGGFGVEVPRWGVSLIGFRAHRKRYPVVDERKMFRSNWFVCIYMCLSLGVD